MSSKSNAFDIKTILSEDQYVIPIYQRNFAWGKAEISQLIRDINESNESNKSVYYIGTLVCFKRENGDFEVIDGQQRLTTIALINAVLEKKIVNKTNLIFDSRINSQKLLEGLYINNNNIDKYLDETNISGIQNFKEAINIIREELHGINNKELFSENFYKNVKIFRVEVPEDTDIIHYFEIMNNRGEQLEKHEIVKAKLMSKININEHEIFALIWDACSNMSNYIYLNFDKVISEKLFSKGEINSKITLTDNLLFKPNVIIQNENNIKINNEIQENTLENILKSTIIIEETIIETKGEKEKYKSVIDFPNFLLQVLKVLNQNCSLDDKKLIDEFDNSTISPEDFILNLLKYRCLFDKYIIKQDLSSADEDERNWGIRIHNDKFEGTIKTFDKDGEDDELVKTQTMLYYSNPSNANNNWVHEILKNEYYKSEVSVFSNNIFEIAKNKFVKEKLSYPDISTFNLYFIDLLLWKLYKVNAKGKDKIEINVENEKYKLLIEKIFRKKNEFHNFKFKQLNSKEHLLAIASPFGRELIEKFKVENLINGIGNLCLISSSQNSSGNKENPSDKRKRFKDNSSLKRLIMFESFNGETWGKDEIEKHQNEIIELINFYVPDIKIQ